MLARERWGGGTGDLTSPRWMGEWVGGGRGGGTYERTAVGYEDDLSDVGRDGGLARGVPRERLTRQWDEVALGQ